MCGFQALKKKKNGLWEKEYRKTLRKLRLSKKQREEHLKTNMTQQDRGREARLRLIRSPILPFCRFFNYVCTVQSCTHSLHTCVSGSLKKEKQKNISWLFWQQQWWLLSVENRLESDQCFNWLTWHQVQTHSGKAWYSEVLLGPLIPVYAALREASSRVIFKHLTGKSHSSIQFSIQY